MRNPLLLACIVAGCLSSPLAVRGQEVVHAITGTVSAINAAQKTITVLQDNGSTALFQDLTNRKANIAFDKHVAAEVTAAGTFDKQGDYVIVFYFGNSDARTVVGLKSLGSGPFTATVGTLKKLDNHAHVLTLQDDTGAEKSFKLGSETVGEGQYGVVEGLKLSADKGAKVRVVAATIDGAATALFVRTM